MKFIELHNNEQKIAVRTDCIVSFTETDTVTLVNVVDESNPWHVEETYDEIMEMIRRGPLPTFWSFDSALELSRRLWVGPLAC